MASLFCTRTTCILSSNTASKISTTPVFASASLSTFARPPPSTNASTSRLPKSYFAPTRPGTRHSSTTTPADSRIPEHILTWNRFFDLRKKRRWINLGCSVITAVAVVGVGAPQLANMEFDSWGAQISGLDPIIVLGISTFTIAAGGWLCGPSFGSAMFSLWAARRGWNKLIAEKEKSFYARIKRYRADPSASSPQNPIPDYYGERISSVKDYRRWLKDQKAFNLKKDKAML